MKKGERKLISYKPLLNIFHTTFLDKSAIMALKDEDLINKAKLEKNKKISEALKDKNYLLKPDKNVYSSTWCK